jgi:hypothetical protein
MTYIIPDFIQNLEQVTYVQDNNSILNNAVRSHKLKLHSIVKLRLSLTA